MFGIEIQMTNLFKYLFFCLIFFYAIFLSQFGFENWDTGYITSFSWRILNGEHPYVDFFYKFPPVTIYFHALWLYILPEEGEYYFTRFINYMLFALQVFFTVSAFDNYFNFKSLKIDKWAIMCVGFTISLLNFPAFAWNTIDGLLFASAAFYLMSIKNLRYCKLVLIAFLCILSAGTKQSFYVIPLLFIAWIFIENGIKSALVFGGFTLMYLVVFFTFIHHIAGFDAYFRLTTGETNLFGLFYVGILEYYLFFHNILVSVSVIMVTALLTYFTKSQKSTILHNLFRIFPLVLIATSIIMCFLNEFRIASKIAFVALALLLVYRYFFEKDSLKKLGPIAVALGIAWSSSISFGYSYPIFYATGLLSGILVLAYADIAKLLPKSGIMAIGFILFFIGLSNNYTLYREKPLPELQYSMEAVSPKLRFVKSSKANVEKHLELKNLVLKYGPNFIVAPSIPATNYMFNEQSNLPADWIINTEVNRQYDFFVTLSSDKKNFIFLEKSYLEGEEMSLANKRETSEISWQIYTTFKKVGQTKYFIIYNGLK